MDAFKESLLVRSQAPPAKCRLYSLSDFLGVNVHPTEKAKLLRSIRDGDVVAFLKGKRQIGNLLLEDNPLPMIRKSAKVDSLLSVIGASRKYDLLTYEVKAIFMHVLARKSGMNLPRVDASLIDDFFSRYTLARKIGKQVGVNGLALQRRIAGTPLENRLIKFPTGRSSLQFGIPRVVWFAKPSVVAAVRKVAIAVAKKKL